MDMHFAEDLFTIRESDVIPGFDIFFLKPCSHLEKIYPKF